MKQPSCLQTSMGELVLSHLQSKVDFSHLYGALTDEQCFDVVIAGQAVASAVSELFGDGRGVVYNDVDAFLLVTTSESTTWKSFEPQIKKRSVVTRLTTEEIEIQQDYGQLKCWTESVYRLRACSRTGLLNEILCTYSPQFYQRSAPREMFNQHECLRFLRTFDFNCVQVGVRLSDKSLVWTPAFERFHATHEMLVETVKTPLHTAIRWFKKKHELDGIYAHDDRAMELLCAAKCKLDMASQWFLERNSADLLELFKPAAKRSPEIQNSDVSNWIREQASKMVFSKAYRERLEAVSSDVQRYFTPRRLEGSRIELSTLEVNSHPNLDMSIIKGMSSQLLPLYVRAKQGHWKKHISRQVLEMFSLFRDDREVRKLSNAYKFHVLSQQGVEVPQLLGEPSHKKDFVQVSKDIEEHVGMSRLCGSLSHARLVALSKAVHELSKTKGRYVFGFLDQVPGALYSAIAHCELSDIPGCVAGVFEKHEQETQVLLSKAKFLLKNPISGVLFRGYRIEELRDAKELLTEGQEMHHCVGGYINAVAAGHCAIVRFHQHRVQDRLTMEVRLSKNGYWTGGSQWNESFRAYQLKGLGNRRPTKEEEQTAHVIVRALTIRKAFGWKLPFSMCLTLAEKLPLKVLNKNIDWIFSVCIRPRYFVKYMRLSELSKASKKLLQKLPGKSKPVESAAVDEFGEIPF